MKASESRRRAPQGKRTLAPKPRRSKAFVAELRRQCEPANDADRRELAVLREADRGDDWADYPAWPIR